MPIIHDPLDGRLPELLVAADRLFQVQRLRAALPELDRDLRPIEQAAHVDLAYRVRSLAHRLRHPGPYKIPPTVTAENDEPHYQPHRRRHH